MNKAALRTAVERERDALVLSKLRFENALMREALFCIENWTSSVPLHIYKTMNTAYRFDLAEGWMLIDALRGIRVNLDKVKEE